MVMILEGSHYAYTKNYYKNIEKINQDVEKGISSNENINIITVFSLFITFMVGAIIWQSSFHASLIVTVLLMSVIFYFFMKEKRKLNDFYENSLMLLIDKEDTKTFLEKHSVKKSRAISYAETIVKERNYFYYSQKVVNIAQKILKK